MASNAPSETASTARLQRENRSRTLAVMVARILRTLTDKRGAISAEYALLVGFVGIAGAAALLTLGPSIVNAYDHTKGTLILPIP